MSTSKASTSAPKVTAPKSKVSSPSDFRRASSTGENVELPSGNTVTIRIPGMQSLMTQGVIPDSLMGLAQSAVDRGKNAAPVDSQVNAATTNPQQMRDALLAFDKIAAVTIIAPTTKLHLVATNEIDTATGERVMAQMSDDDRESDVLYTDEIEMEDKMFLFNVVVGGTRDLEAFRKESSEALARVQPV